jgi:hypothetical protein
MRTGIITRAVVPVGVPRVISDTIAIEVVRVISAVIIEVIATIKSKVTIRAIPTNTNRPCRRVVVRRAVIVPRLYVVTSP